MTLARKGHGNEVFVLLLLSFYDTDRGHTRYVTADDGTGPK